MSGATPRSSSCTFLKNFAVRQMRSGSMSASRTATEISEPEKLNTVRHVAVLCVRKSESHLKLCAPNTTRRWSTLLRAAAATVYPSDSLPRVPKSESLRSLGVSPRWILNIVARALASGSGTYTRFSNLCKKHTHTRIQLSDHMHTNTTPATPTKTPTDVAWLRQSPRVCWLHQAPGCHHASEIKNPT